MVEMLNLHFAEEQRYTLNNWILFKKICGMEFEKSSIESSIIESLISSYRLQRTKNQNSFAFEAQNLVIQIF